MKNLLTVFLCVVLCVGFITSCGQQEPAQPAVEQPAAAPAEQPAADTPAPAAAEPAVSDATPVQ